MTAFTGTTMTLQDTKPILITCPGCKQPSESIKRYTMPQIVVFLWLFAWWRRVTYTLCPSCMRKTIGERMAINIIPANLMWPVLAIFWLILLGRTFTKGHSKSVLQQISQ
jgi:hypothetical protein